MLETSVTLKIYMGECFFSYEDNIYIYRFHCSSYIDTYVASV